VLSEQTRTQHRFVTLANHQPSEKTHSQQINPSLCSAICSVDYTTSDITKLCCGYSIALPQHSKNLGEHRIYFLKRAVCLTPQKYKNMACKISSRK
jgi:hypothetical protein